jgi:hypothetical protein
VSLVALVSERQSHRCFTAPLRPPGDRRRTNFQPTPVRSSALTGEVRISGGTTDGHGYHRSRGGDFIDEAGLDTGYLAAEFHLSAPRIL